LKVEPGWRRPCETRLYWLSFFPGAIPTIALIAPVRGSIAISAEAGSVLSVTRSRIAFFASRWSRGSIVV